MEDRGLTSSPDQTVQDSTPADDTALGERAGLIIQKFLRCRRDIPCVARRVLPSDVPRHRDIFGAIVSSFRESLERHCIAPGTKDKKKKGKKGMIATHNSPTSTSKTDT